jgi:hypothetical protein
MSFHSIEGRPSISWEFALRLNSMDLGARQPSGSLTFRTDCAVERTAVNSTLKTVLAVAQRALAATPVAQANSNVQLRQQSHQRQPHGLPSS